MEWYFDKREKQRVTTRYFKNGKIWRYFLKCPLLTSMHSGFDFSLMHILDEVNRYFYWRWILIAWLQPWEERSFGIFLNKTVPWSILWRKRQRRKIAEFCDSWNIVLYSLSFLLIKILFHCTICNFSKCTCFWE